jgi:WxL domain surface cell wall-binding
MKNILKFRLNRHLLSLAMGVGMLGVLIVGNVGTALADGGGDLSPTITGGQLDVSNTSLPTITSSVTLDGHDTTLTVSIPLTVNDPTGTGAGWKLQLATTQFHATAATLPFRTIPTNATTFTSVTGVACGTGSTCSAPTSTVGSVTVPVAAATSDGTTISFGSATATSIYNAATNTGMGINGLTAGFTVHLPANTTYAGSYTSAFTETIASAP